MVNSYNKPWAASLSVSTNGTTIVVEAATPKVLAALKPAFPTATCTFDKSKLPELRKIVEKADPSGSGVITFEGLRRVLSDLGSEQAAEHGALTAASSGGVGGDLQRIQP